MSGFCIFFFRAAAFQWRAELSLISTSAFEGRKVMRNNNESRADKWCLLTKKYAKKKNTLLIFVPTAVLQGMKGRFFNTETVSAFRIAWSSFRLTFEWCSVWCYEKQMIWEERGKRIWELFWEKKWGELIRDPEREEQFLDHVKR